jgi:hypothetical protein
LTGDASPLAFVGRSGRKVLGCGFVVLVVPVLLAIRLVMLPFERPSQSSAAEVAETLRDFIAGGGDWEFEDLISTRLADPRLESIRQRARQWGGPTDGMAPLQALLDEAEAIAAENARSSAG